MLKRQLQPALKPNGYVNPISFKLMNYCDGNARTRMQAGKHVNLVFNILHCKLLLWVTFF